jgi:hypothetical protein
MNWAERKFMPNAFIRASQPYVFPDNNNDKPKAEAVHLEWEEPITPGQLKTPDIPSSVLPTWLKDYVQEVSDSTQTPMGMAVLMALSVVSTCNQKRFEVSPYGGDYKEPLSLWTVTAMPPASRKTAITTALTGPLDKWEREQQARMKDEIASVETKRAINLKAIDRLLAEASKTDDSLERKNLIKEIDELKANTPDEVFSPRLWTGDVTPERLQGLLVEQGERMSLISDEGGIFEIMGGLYSDGRANLDVFLQSHAGKSIRVDRGKRTVRLDKPSLAFGLAIQPSVLNDFGYGSKKRFRGNGTLARFLYCIPKSNIGTRKMGKRTLISEAVKLAYNDNISALLEIQPLLDDDGMEIPRVLTLSSEALKAWEEFSQGVENKQGEYGEFEPIQDWTGKLPGASLRIAGSCHVAEHKDQTLVISLETMERALDLCGLLIPHAQSAFGMMGTDPAVDDAEVILKWIISEGKESFTRGYCHKSHRGRFKKLDRLVKALDILHGWNVISEPEIMKPKTAGRPSIVYNVNPSVLKEGK